jgi:alanyl-tRNA synthetase
MEWVGSALTELGGKGGGKGNTAQGQGANIEKVDDAIAAATKFAELKLQ